MLVYQLLVMVISEVVMMQVNEKYSVFVLSIYFVAGAADPVIRSPKAWQKAQSFMRKLGYTRVEGKLFDGLRHEILNELDRSPIFSDLLKWMMS